MKGKELYTKDQAEWNIGQGTKKYRPSNGTEGEIFMGMWCENCVFEDEDDPCRIVFMSMLFGVEEEEYPEEWIYDADGQPRCTSFVSRKKKRFGGYGEK